MNDKPKRAPKARGPGLIGRAVRGVFRVIWAFGWRLAVVGFVILAVTTGWFLSGLPEPDDLFDGRGAGSVVMEDANGQTFAWRGEQYGGDLRVANVSPHLVHAIVATEDRRFWGHIGLDPRGIARAMVANIRAGSIVQGGSTLTQQVAKVAFLDASRTFERKLKEVPMALALELKYTKEEILSVYLNRVYLGAGTYGFEAASQRYFGKSARDVTVAEAAMLAGLLRAPSSYAPTSDIAKAQGRASQVVRLMEEEGYITPAQTIEALANPAVLSDAAAKREGGAFADWVMEDGLPIDTSQYRTDLLIRTTFDPRAQAIAEQALADVFEQKVKDGSKAEAAIVVMTHDGAVVAMVGGRERGASRFNRATQALRQTGSAFKTIVYATALEAGMSPLDIVDDAPLTIGKWSPSNYDNKFRGPMTLREALAKSINTVAVRVSEQAGRERVRTMAARLGLTTPVDVGPALALGTSEARLVEMTGVFATIANGGRRVLPHGYREIRLRDDGTLLTAVAEPFHEQVMSRRNAGLLTNMLQTVVEYGTGRRAQIPGWEVAGKTGTTQRARDAWFIGFTADYVTGVWMGYDDNSPLTGTTGGGLPAEIWRETMVRLHEGREPKPLHAINPTPTIEPRVVLGPMQTPQAGGGDSVVEQIFRDVLRGLGGDGNSGGGSDFEPYTSDR